MRSSVQKLSSNFSCDSSSARASSLKPRTQVPKDKEREEERTQDEEEPSPSHIGDGIRAKATSKETV